MTRVYRLTVIYPEGSHEPGWRPESWDEFLASLTWRQRREAERRGFRWPRERLFLSSSGAYGRAALLRWMGAEVEVLASDPVTWPNYDDAADRGNWEDGCTAARWSPLAEEYGRVYMEGDDIASFRESLKAAG